jgi:uncharacterized protein (DUF2141 family)
MSPKYFFYCASLLLVLLTMSCANIVAPTGGAKDTKPPQVVQAKSTPNGQTNFKKQPITLIFDEYVTLQDAATQVVVSPPLNETPTVTALGRIVKFEFADGDTLRENATYTINFGTSVRDFTEGNIANDLRFVFSTGATLDSLTFSGKVVDAFTGEAVEGVLLMLYNSFADSVVRKQKPFYFSRTDKQGAATIRNVRAGQYKLFALKDADFNYRLSQETEPIGFPDAKTVTVAAIDTNATNSDSLQIRLFQPAKTLRVQSKNTDNYGIVRLLMTRNAANIGIKTSNEAGEKTLVEYDKLKDSVLVWYNTERESAWNLYLALDSARTDTLRVRARNKPDFLKKHRLDCLTIPPKTANTPEVTLGQHPLKPLELQFNTPISAIDSNKISLLDSANRRVAIILERDSAQPRSLRLHCNWDESMPYRVQIEPQAVTDFYGVKNDSLLSSKMFIRPRKEFGDFKLKVTGLEAKKYYVAQLVLDGTKSVIQTFRITPAMVQDSAWSASVEALEPNNYGLRVIEDRNQNGVWDTGNYDRHEQAERVWYKKIESLRSAWEVEAMIELLN